MTPVGAGPSVDDVALPIDVFHDVLHAVEQYGADGLVETLVDLAQEQGWRGNDCTVAANRG